MIDVGSDRIHQKELFLSVVCNNHAGYPAFRMNFLREPFDFLEMLYTFSVRCNWPVTSDNHRSHEIAFILPSPCSLQLLIMKADKLIVSHLGNLQAKYGRKTSSIRSLI